MTVPSNLTNDADIQRRLVELFRVIAAGQTRNALRMLDRTPMLATAVSRSGASVSSASRCFLEDIKHHFYSGDTALHIAAASYDSRLVSQLLRRGAGHAIKNRRGAEPLHYAADTNRDDAARQAQTIAALCSAGANPNAVATGGVTPLHRAVRTRGLAAVKALLAAGADPRLRNRSGSTPFDLTRHNTGRGGTGTPVAIRQREQIAVALVEHGR
jgi:ankyrin repeat protein